MERTIGKKLLDLRKQSGFTQDYVAEKLGVSAQAVSKWENDIACPDIMTLPQIALLYGITVDELFNNDQLHSKAVFEKEDIKTTEIIDESELYLRVFVTSSDGNVVKVNLPFLLVKELVNTGISISGVFGTDLSGVDLESVFAMVEKGIIGDLVSVDSSDGTNVRVAVEK